MMDSPLSIPKTTTHIRSNSLPSKSHPLRASIEDLFYTLKASESQFSAPAICSNLGSLKDLYERINNLIQLQSIERALSKEKWVANEVLDGSLRLLDLCSSARDILCCTKESIQELESCLRRKRGAETVLEHEVGAYMISRKKSNKMASKCIKNMRSFAKFSYLTVSDENSDLSTFINMLREAETISNSVLKSVLTYTSVSKQRGWSKFSQILQPKRDTQEETNGHDVKKVDAALYALTIKKASKEINGMPVQNVVKQLQTLELLIQELEDALEPIFRCIVKTRVSLLNVLNL